MTVHLLFQIIMTLVIVAATFWIIGKMVLSVFAPGLFAPQRLCVQCEFKGKAKPETKGSIGVEIILWLCFLLPGMIYSVWRLSNKSMICPSCGCRDLVPLDSPRAKKILAS